MIKKWQCQTGRYSVFIPSDGTSNNTLGAIQTTWPTALRQRHASFNMCTSLMRQFDQCWKHRRIWHSGCTKRRNEQTNKKTYAPFMTAAEYKRVCWYFSYECDRCYVIINVQPRKMVSVVWGTLYVRWNKTLSVRPFQQITSERGGMCNKLGQWTIHAPDSVLL